VGCADRARCLLQTSPVGARHHRARRALRNVDASDDAARAARAQTEALFPPSASTTAAGGLTIERGRALKTGALVLHRAPVNRGPRALARSRRWAQERDLEQVENGVAVRKAISGGCHERGVVLRGAG